MGLLRVFEVVIVVFYLLFLVSEIFIPLARSTPLFPTFRNDSKKKEKTNAK